MTSCSSTLQTPTIAATDLNYCAVETLVNKSEGWKERWTVAEIRWAFEHDTRVARRCYFSSKKD